MKVLPANEMETYFGRYIGLVDDIPVKEALAAYTESILGFVNTIPEELGTYRYQPEKWTVNQVLRHVIDTERIFAYRALTIAREGQVDLPGYDETLYGQTAGEPTDINLLKREFALIRVSTNLLFNSLPETTLLNMGTMDKKPISVNGLGYVIIGHALHHNRIIQEQYMKL